MVLMFLKVAMTSNPNLNPADIDFLWWSKTEHSTETFLMKHALQNILVLRNSRKVKIVHQFKQGVWNRREIQQTRPALPYDYACFADGHSICIRNICLMYNYRVYNNLFWIFHIQMYYCLQRMYNHMVGQAASIVSPFYFILLA